MASTYSATVLEDAVYVTSKQDGFQSFETRGSVYGALDAAIANTPALVPKSKLESLRVASGRTVKLDVFKKEAIGNGTARACSGSGNGATASVNLSWQTLSETFQLSTLDLAENNYSYEEMFQMRLAEKLKSLYKRIDSVVIANLEANYSAGAGTTWATFNNAFQVPLSDYDLATNRASFWLNKVKVDFMKNDLDMDNIEVVGSSEMTAIFSNMMNQREQTATNLGFQLEGLKPYFTNRITNNTGIYATNYVFQKGQMGLLTWVNKLEQLGKDIGTDVWGSFQDPRYGMTIGLKVKKSCTDNSSNITGAEADYIESFVLAIDVATPIAYSSDSNSGIYKYELDENNSTLSGSGSYV